MSVPGFVTFQVPTSGLPGFGAGVVEAGLVVVDGTGVVVLVVVEGVVVVGFVVVDFGGFVVLGVVVGWVVGGGVGLVGLGGVGVVGG